VQAFQSCDDGARGGAALLRPKEIRARLAVSAATLRVWSIAYRDYLSTAAQVGPAAGHAHRRYTAADVQVLTRIRELVRQGHRSEAIKRLLMPAPRSEEPAAPQAGPQEAELAERLRDLEAALAKARAGAEQLEEEAEDYEHWLGEEQAAHAETRRALVEAQRRLVEAERKLAETEQAKARLAEANLGLHAQVAQLEHELNAPMWRRVLR